MHNFRERSPFYFILSGSRTGKNTFSELPDFAYYRGHLMHSESGANTAEHQNVIRNLENKINLVSNSSTRAISEIAQLRDCTGLFGDGLKVCVDIADPGWWCTPCDFLV
jgi:hypothetical protein